MCNVLAAKSSATDFSFLTKDTVYLLESNSEEFTTQ